ncbi:unnamed protein product, partial [Musa textilis]
EPRPHDPAKISEGLVANAVPASRCHEFPSINLPLLGYKAEGFEANPRTRAASPPQNRIQSALFEIPRKRTRPFTSHLPLLQGSREASRRFKSQLGEQRGTRKGGGGRRTPLREGEGGILPYSDR